RTRLNTSLTQLYLNSNSLSGTLPAEWSSISDVLTFLDVSRNCLSGDVSSSWPSAKLLTCDTKLRGNNNSACLRGASWPRVCDTSTPSRSDSRSQKTLTEFATSHSPTYSMQSTADTLAHSNHSFSRLSVSFSWHQSLPREQSISDSGEIAAEAAFTATTVAASAATTAATVSIMSGAGDPSQSMSLVILALLECSKNPPVSVGTYFISVFFGLGNVAMSLGNIGLAMVIGILHAVIARLMLSLQTVGSSDDDDPWLRLECAYFPGWTIKLQNILFPGSTVGGVAGAVASASSSETASCIIALVLVAAFIAVQIWIQQRVVLSSRATFVPYTTYSVGLLLERRFLFPSARWETAAIRRAFSPLIGAMKTGYSLLSMADLLLACCVGAVSGAYLGGACDTPLLAIVAALYFLLSCAFVDMRPCRLPLDTVIVPMNYFFLGCICALKYDGNRGADVVSGLQLTVSVLQIGRTLCTLYVTMYREPQLRLDDSPYTGVRSVDDDAEEHDDVDIPLLLYHAVATTATSSSGKFTEVTSIPHAPPGNSKEYIPPSLPSSVATPMDDNHFLANDLSGPNDTLYWDVNGHAIVKCDKIIQSSAHQHNELSGRFFDVPDYMLEDKRFEV
ncbi:GP46-like surface antigen, putative, partial [Bodo saltans]